MSEKEKPKMILMQTPGENVSNVLLYELAKKMNIQTFMPMDIHYKNHIHISSNNKNCLLYTSPSPRDGLLSRMPSSA